MSYSVAVIIFYLVAYCMYVCALLSYIEFQVINASGHGMKPILANQIAEAQMLMVEGLMLVLFCILLLCGL